MRERRGTDARQRACRGVRVVPTHSHRTGGRCLRTTSVRVLSRRNFSRLRHHIQPPLSRRERAEMPPSPPDRRRGILCSILLALILSFNHFTRDAPGTIEEQLREDTRLRVTSDRYATMTAAYFLPSAFVPLAMGILSSLPSEQGAAREDVPSIHTCTPRA